jgi:hypothetical protein
MDGVDVARGAHVLDGEVDDLQASGSCLREEVGDLRSVQLVLLEQRDEHGGARLHEGLEVGPEVPVPRVVAINGATLFLPGSEGHAQPPWAVDTQPVDANGVGFGGTNFHAWASSRGECDS